MAPLRIAIDAAFLGGRAEGIDTYARSVIEHLAGSGDEIFVYTPDRVGLNGQGLVRWRRTPAAFRATTGSLGNILRVMAWSQTALPLGLLRDRAQVLLSTLPEGMLAPVCPQVIVVHDLFPLFFPERYPRWKHYFKHVLPLVLKASCCVIAVSKHTKRDLVRHLGVPEDKIVVIYSWVDPVFFSGDAGVPPEGYETGPYFLFVGRSSPHKNLEMVIRALARMPRQMPHRLVCVVGLSGPDDLECWSRVLRLAAELGVHDRLRVYSELPRRQLLFLYRGATALLMLSKYEGFGYPPLEAMATGTPAIVSDSTSLAEVSGPGAVCVPNTDPCLAAEAMLRLASDPRYKASLAEAGLSWAKKFTREVTGDSMRALLRRCAGVA